MSEQYEIGGGLVGAPEDARDFSHERVFGSLAEEELPVEDFTVAEPFDWKDQGDSDLCTAFAACAVSEDQELVKLEPAYLFAKTKQIRNEYTSWGADLRSACRAAVKYGFLESSQAPDMNLKVKDRDFLANWMNWPSYYDMYAADHRKQSFFKVDGSYDTFDNIRSALWKHKDEEQSVYTGATWKNSWTHAPGGIIPKVYEPTGYGHAFKIYGQKTIDRELFLVAQLSNGKNIGDQGKFYFPREVVNKEFVFGNYMFVDMTKETAKALNSVGLPPKYSLLARIIYALTHLF